MEKQWKAAVEAVNENKLQHTIDDLNNQLNQQNKLVITLRKENQTLRLKAHMAEDDIQLESRQLPTGNDGISLVAMDRIKELERQLKQKEADYQEKLLQYKTQNNDLELLAKTNEKNMQTASKKVDELMEENQQLRRLSQGDEQTKLRIELKAAKEKINLIEQELKKINEHSKQEVSLMQERCKRMQEELDNSMNADRNLKDRAGQLQVINSQLQKQVNEQDGDLIKLQKIKHELIEERDHYMRERLEYKAIEDSYRNQIQQLTETNVQIDQKNQDLMRKLQGADPERIREQRDLINDLKKKVQIYEVELKKVHENSENQIGQYRREAEALMAQKMDEDFTKDMERHVEKLSIQKMKQELITSKQELEEAARQVTNLNMEIKAQQKYYEDEINQLKFKLGQTKSISGVENDTIQIAALQAKVKSLENRLKDQYIEKEECLKQVTMLKEELKLQEEHFSKELNGQLNHANSVAQSSLLNDGKFVELMTKLNDEQRKYYKEKTHFEHNVKVTAEMARQKVKELETELDKQQKFFEQQTQRYEQEITMLKEYNASTYKDTNNKDDQIKILFAELEKYKRDKKDQFGQIKSRDIEIQKLNKKIIEFQQKLIEAQSSPSGKRKEQASRAPSANVSESGGEQRRQVVGIILPDIKKTPGRPSSQQRGTKQPSALIKGIGVESFFMKWNSSGNNDIVKTELLDQVIGDNSLKLDCVKRKQEFLLVLHQAFETVTPQIYERATIIVSELIDAKWIQQSELVALNAIKKIIRTLAPKKPTEDNNYAMSRQISSLNLLCKLDKWDIEWNNAMSEEMSRISGVDTIIHYLEQSQHDNYKSQAAQIVGMIAEEASINNVLLEHDTMNILIDSILNKTIIVKRNCAEALAFFIKDEQVREGINNDRILQVVLNELQKSNDQIFSENLLLILMNLSLSKHFKPAIYEAGLLDSLIFNLVNGHTTEEQIYATRIAFNLCYNGEIKSRNYDKLAPYLMQVIKQNKDDVSIQALLLLKKMTENERTNPQNDIKILPALIECIALDKDKRIQDLAMKEIMILCENNPKFVLPEFQTKGNGIATCIQMYTSNNDANLSLYASHILVMYCLEGFVGEINQMGKIDYLNTLLRNFSAQDENIRVQAIKMMSLLLQDQYIHEIVYSLSDFQFLIHDASEMVGYDQLYKEEQDLLLYVLRIFGEFSKTPKMAEGNTTNGIIPVCVKLLMDKDKYRKELRMWATIVVNRGCYHNTNQISDKIMEICLKTNPPGFLTFLVGITDPEDTDFTSHTKNIWQKLDEMGKSKNQQLISQLEKNYELVEKLIMGTKRTIGSKADINTHMKNLINWAKNASPNLDRMIKDATKNLQK